MRPISESATVGATAPPRSSMKLLVRRLIAEHLARSRAARRGGAGAAAAAGPSRRDRHRLSHVAAIVAIDGVKCTRPRAALDFRALMLRVRIDDLLRDIEPMSF